MRDYDFSVLLSEHNKGRSGFSIPDDFGVLHGNIFRHFVNSETYKANFRKAPVICLSVSSKIFTVVPVISIRCWALSISKMNLH